MAKKFKIFSEILLGAASALTLGYATTISPAHACEGDTSGQTNCADEVLVISPAPESDDIYADAGAEVKSERNVSHSFFLAGNDVSSSDHVNGINFLAGNLVEFTGSADYGAFAGNSLKVNGQIKNDLFIAGNAIELGEDTTIGRDLYAAATTVLIKSNLYGNAFVGAERLVLENVTIDGNLNVEATNIVIKGKAAISGAFTYNDNAQITGLENLAAGETATYAGHTTEVSFGTSLTTKLVFLLGRLLVTIIFVAVAGKFSRRLLDEFNPKTCWKDLALGLGLLLAVPIAAIFVMITFIGLPLGIISLATYIFFAYMASSVTGGVVGNLLAKHLFKNEKLHIFLKYTIGIIVLQLLGLIPIVGGLISAISTCFGFGYLVKMIFKRERAGR